MIEKTHGIVLRYAPFSETSRVVTWLSLSGGKIATTIKGAQRPRNQFLGQYDLFYTCELLYYSRGRNDIHIAKECAPLKTRTRFRTDWRAAAAASYLATLASRITPASAPNPDLYYALDDALDFLAQHGASLPFLFWFELKLLESHGHAPRLQRCQGCSRPLLEQRGLLGINYRDGGILCAECMRSQAETLPAISRDVLAMLSGWQRARSSLATQTTRTTPRQLKEIEHIMGRFISFHLDINPSSRDTALEIVHYDPERSTLSYAARENA